MGGGRMGHTMVFVVPAATLELAPNQMIWDSGILFDHLGWVKPGPLRILGQIDPYCGGFLNGLQMPDFVQDLEVVRKDIRDEADEVTVNELEAAARRVAGSKHLLLCFSGD